MVAYVESRQEDEEDERVFMGHRDPKQHAKDAKQLAEEQWNRAAAVLSARPSLLTSKVLRLVLKNRPPAHVVQFLLSINPRVADIPKHGPTALHVAIRHHASHEVIKTVIEACPLALVASHDGCEPLLYAKTWRSDEPELLQLLSIPLSHWMSKAVKKKKKRKSRASLPSPTALIVPHAQAVPAPITTSPAELSSSHSFVASPVVFTEDGKKELDNIKAIASTIVRAQKKQIQAMAQHKQHVESSLQDYRAWNVQERTGQLQELEKLQTDHFRAQLIALDMKEKSMVAKVRAMERRVVKAMELSKEIRSHREARQKATINRLETTLKTFYAVMNEHQASAQERVAAVEMRLEQECKMNEYFRSDTRLQLDQFEQYRVLDTQQARTEYAPIVYTTPKNHDEDDDTLDTEPLFSVPAYGKATRRKYPRRRNKRGPLGLLHF